MGISLLKELRFIKSDPSYKHLAPSGAKAVEVRVIVPRLSSHSPEIFFHFYRYQLAYRVTGQIHRAESFVYSQDAALWILQR